MQQITKNPFVYGPVVISPAQKVELDKSWTERKVKELRGYSDSTIISKLLNYSEEDLKTIIDYADTLPFYIRGASRIYELAKEVRRQKEEKIRQQQIQEEIERKKREEVARREKEERLRKEKEERIKKDFLKLILTPSEKNMEVVDTLYKKDSHLMESVVSVQKECPLLFEGEDVVELFESNPALVRGLLQYYNNNKELCKSLLTSINSIKKADESASTIEGYYTMIPRELCMQLVVIMHEEPLPPMNDDDILRYYILKSSKPFPVGDFFVFVIKKILKALLGIKILPIPNVTTVYLFIIWTDMLKLFTWKHFGDKFLSKDKIIAIALSILAMLLQLLNRETPLAYLKNIYSGSVMAKDFVSKMPTDLKNLLVNTLFKGANEISNGRIEEILSYNFITWNNVLGELTEIDNLSMGKTIDMLYTFRVGTTFLDYVKNGNGLEIHSLSDYWRNYGPLPNNLYQMERLFDLFRSVSQGRYQERCNDTYRSYKQIIHSATTYSMFLQSCKKLYEELAFLSVAYCSHSYEVKLLYTLAPKKNMELIAEVSIRSMEMCSLDEVRSSSVLRVERNLLDTIQQSSHLIV